MSIEAIRKALEAYPEGWGSMDKTWPVEGSEFGEHEVGSIDEVGNTWPVISVCPGIYYQEKAAAPMAAFIAACNPTAIRALLQRLDEAEAEVQEQARLNGMGAERELALRARLDEAEKALQWRPIETAPEGTMILCANMKAREARDWCFVAWIVGGKVYGHRMDMPTHWLPLPPAPND